MKGRGTKFNYRLSRDIDFPMKPSLGDILYSQYTLSFVHCSRANIFYVMGLIDVILPKFLFSCFCVQIWQNTSA